MSVFPLELSAQLGVRVVKVPQHVLWPMTAEETLCVCNPSNHQFSSVAQSF